MTDSITCPRCGRTSWNPNDVREGYCGACHEWTNAGSWPAKVGTAMHEAAEWATSQQAAHQPSEEWRAMVKRGADFCRRNPAAWSQSVRYSDSLIAQGVERDEAVRQALELYDV